MLKKKMLLLPVFEPIFPYTKEELTIENDLWKIDFDIAFKGNNKGYIFCVVPINKEDDYDNIKKLGYEDQQFNQIGTVCQCQINRDKNTLELKGIYCATFKSIEKDSSQLEKDIAEIQEICNTIISTTSNNDGNVEEGISASVINIPWVNVYHRDYDQIDAETEMSYINMLDTEVQNLSKYGPVAKPVQNAYVKANSLDEKINTILSITNGDKQKLLEETDEYQRLCLACVVIKEAINNIGIIKDVEKIVQERLNSGQKEFFLREQIKAINQELGDDNREFNTLKEKIDNLKASKEVKDKLLYDLNRWSNMPQVVPEYSILRDYLDVATSLPWGIYTKDNFDLKNIREILDKDHYGIEKVKERIIEYIAVRKIAPDLNAPILCLVGAPGVGKTSIAQSVAKAIGREYLHMSLGGINDEAEIRGHRRTYVGAMPGRIISEMRKAKTSNPMFLLDEIDKIGLDKRKDPSSALLEVLDPSQNGNFRDNYLELPFDLSKVMFVMTANTLSTIQKPLLDRMEVIEMDSYTVEEKVEIACRHLIPKQIKNHGLDKYKVEIEKECVLDIVDKYTSEAGVRELERQIAKICRKIATKIVASDQSEFLINKNNLSEYLGVEKYINTNEDVLGRVGVVNGLAWTSVGGTLLPIEAKLIPGGKGEIILTGKLGEVMQESAKIALSIIKTNLLRYGVSEDLFAHNDIHIHAPEGAIPKDGPSAGVTLATAILSAVTGNKVKDNLAMTGEVTLTGRVLAIGGLKEKLLAAIRHGVKIVIIPKQNEREIAEMPNTILEKIDVKYVNDVNEVFKIACEVVNGN